MMEQIISNLWALYSQHISMSAPRVMFEADFRKALADYAHIVETEMAKENEAGNLT